MSVGVRAWALVTDNGGITLDEMHEDGLALEQIMGDVAVCHVISPNTARRLAVMLSDWADRADGR